MTVVLYDVLRERSEVIESVTRFEGRLMQIKGGLSNVWVLHLADKSQRAYSAKNYTILRIED